jgi:hypothetical protein
MAKKTFDSGLLIQANIIIWAISGNIQMQPFSLHKNGVALGLFLCLLSGGISYFSSSTLLKRGD